MIRTAVLAAIAFACLIVNADARPRSGPWQSCIPTSDVMRPCAYQPDFLAGVRSIRVEMRRVGRSAAKVQVQRKSAGGAGASKAWAEEINLPANKNRHLRAKTASKEITPSFSASIARPLRFIAGRLICAVNVNAALAERGIRGTGSALAMSFRHWGRSAGGPVPGAVIVSARRGGGHVAIVSRVANGVVYAWNATGGQRGWREIPYRHHVIDYRIPS